MAACSIFEEDEVSMVSNKGFKCGLVVESSEYASSDEEEEHQFQYQRVKNGLIRVAWHPNGEEEVVQEKTVKLVDRSLMPGDVVRRFIEGQDSQRGYVRNTDVVCHVQVLGKNKIIRNVNSRDLVPLRYWDTEPGDVTHDSWVGKIEHINEEVTLKFPDNAMCKVCDDEFINELFRFEDVNEKRPNDTEFCTNDYYPGQQFRGELGDLESAKWVKSTAQHSQSAAKKHEHRQVLITVHKVEAKSIEIHWLCRGYAKVENPLARMEPPPRTLNADQISRLKKLDCFEPCSVQLGDKAYYTIKAQDKIEAVKSKDGHTTLDTIMRPEGAADEDENAKNVANSPTLEIGVSSENGVTEAASATQPVAELVDPSQQNGDAAEGESDVEDLENGADAEGELEEEEEEEDNEEQGEEDNELSDTGSTASVHSSASQSSSTASGPAARRRVRKTKGPGLQTKLLKKKRLRAARSRRDSGRARDLRPGDHVPVEIIYTFSVIEVMWQDGSIEKGIASTELYPIHHLDELEFFPGDFVVRNTDIGTTGDAYGVVESVDHLGRTCHVRWMKPYQVGKSNRPDESIVSEEMSVYDIKDHPDYRFRPGHVVVRVGGYEENHTEAAGQVYELTKDGRLLIQWADKSQTYCYPQELYLIGDELSDLGSELDSSTDESEDEESGDRSDGSTEASWETEEEEEVEKDCCDRTYKIRELVVARQEARRQRLEREPGPDPARITDSAPSSRGTMDDDGLDVEPDKKFELDMLLDTAKNTLQKLEDTFAQNVDITPCTIYCYREILSISRNCKELDRMLSSSYFAEPKLVETIQTIKKELKREKAAKIARQVLELFESNCKPNGEKNTEKQEEESGGPTVVLPADSSKPEKRRKKNSKDGSVRSNDQASGDVGPADADDSGMEPQSKAVPKTENPTASGQGPAMDGTGTVENSVQSSGDGTPNAMEASGGPAVKVDSPLDTAAHLEVENALRAKDLCQEACRLLKEQIVRVHEDLEKKWHKLHAAGLLPHAEDEGVDDSLIPHDKLAAVEKIVASAEEATANAMAMLTPTCQPDPKVAPGSSEAKSVAKSEEAEASSVKQDPEPVEKVPAARDGLGLNLTEPAAMATPEKSALEPPTPQTPADVRAKLEYNKDGFHMMESAPSGHRFKNSEHQVTDPKVFFAALKKELKMLHTSLPKGIFVKGFEDRMDLFTVMIHGPARTPYEDGLFFFDVQLPGDYPTAPPSVHYLSYCSDRLNPNLYEDGKVCVSLLGTWAGRGTEVWTSRSSLLQVLISIQGLILVPEPYYNEAGYEKQKGTQQGLENSRMYNEMAILKMVQSLMKMVVHPPVVFETEVIEYMGKRAFRLMRRLEHWLKMPAMSSLTRTPVKSPSTSAIKNSQVASSDPSQSETATSPDSDSSSQTPQAAASAAASPPPSSPAGSEQLKLPLPGPPQGMPEFPLLPSSRGFQITLTKSLEQFRNVLKSVGIADMSAIADSL